jgi:hypothetical protein
MLQGVAYTRARTVVLLALAGAVAALGISALTAQQASAQALGSEFCDEYPNAPGCQDTGPDDGTGANPDDDEAATAAGPSADDGATGGSLPFTGYPLTALILLLLVLLVTGLAIRTYLAIRDRIGRDPTAGP